MFPIVEHLTNYKFDAIEERAGYADVNCNTCFDVRLVKFEGERWVDATTTFYNYRKACKIVNNSISIINTRLKAESCIGEQTIEDDPDLFRWKNNHLLVSMCWFVPLMYRFDRTKPITELLKRNKKWRDYIRGVIYLLYFPKAKEYKMVVKGGKTVNWSKRGPQYKKYGKFLVIAMFYVKYTSPAEELLMKVLADHYGSSIQLDKSSTKKKKKTEYFLIKGVENNRDVIINELTKTIAYEWVDKMPKGDILASWYWQPETDLLLFKRIPRDIQDLSVLGESGFSMMKDKERKDCLKLWDLGEDELEEVLYYRYNQYSVREFLKENMPGTEPTEVLMPWWNYEA